MRLKVLVISVILLEIKYAESTYNNPSYSSTRVMHAPSAGSVDTTNFIKHLENNITSYVQKCCKDEQLCSNSSLSLSSEVYSWPIVTKIDLTNLMKDIKRSIKFQIQFFSVGMNCQDQNQSFSFLPQLQTSIMNEINTKVNEFIEPKLQELTEEIILLNDKRTNYENETAKMITEIRSKTQNIETDLKLQSTDIAELKHLISNSETRISTLTTDLSKAINELADIKCKVGNDNLHKLTSTGEYKLRVDLIFETGKESYAVYSKFHVGHESTGYKLTIEGYSGTAGDALTGDDLNEKNKVNGMKFSTKDRDNDKSLNSCADYWQKSGWWFNSCTFANLNGPYTTAKNGKTTFWTTDPKSRPRLTDIRLMIKLA